MGRRDEKAEYICSFCLQDVTRRDELHFVCRNVKCSRFGVSVERSEYEMKLKDAMNLLAIADEMFDVTPMGSSEILRILRRALAIQQTVLPPHHLLRGRTHDGIHLLDLKTFFFFSL
jgi:hypothetical protein